MRSKAAVKPATETSNVTGSYAMLRMVKRRTLPAVEAARGEAWAESRRPSRAPVSRSSADSHSRFC
jgi:hypothetical protein